MAWRREEINRESDGGRQRANRGRGTTGDNGSPQIAQTTTNGERQAGLRGRGQSTGLI